MKSNTDYQNELRAIGSAMVRIHKMMFESEISDLELKAGQAFSAPAKLQILINAPELAWLRIMSQTMAWVDEIFFQKDPIRPEQIKEAHDKVNDLFIEQTHPEFSAHYRRMMTSLPDLMVEHAHLRTAVKRMEKTG